MRELKNPIKYKITLDEDQKRVKAAIFESEIVIVTGQAGSGKSLVVAQTVLDLIFKEGLDEVFVTRAAIEVGRSLGFLPGELSNKFDPYIEAFRENLYKCYDKEKVDAHLTHLEGGDENKDKKAKSKGTIKGIPVQYIRGKTIDAGQMMIVEEAQNLTKHEMLALLTRLGKGGKIVINGDVNQSDLRLEDGSQTGLHYVIEMAKRLKEIKHFKLQANHRSDLVGKILDYEYGKL